MDYEDRRPSQLARVRKEHYDQVYSRQPQLMERLRQFLNKSDIIEEETEPYLYSPKDPLSKRISMKGRKKINKFSNERKKAKSKTKSTKKISQIRPDVLYGMSR